MIVYFMFIKICKDHLNDQNANHLNDNRAVIIKKKDIVD